MRFRLDKLRKLDWKTLREDKKLKFNIGLAVVLIVSVVLFIDVVLSIRNFRYLEEKVVRPPVKRAAEQRETVKKFKKACKVAIILDDAGGDTTAYREIFSIKEPLTISVLPGLPASGKVAMEARRAGFEVMLHLPMESENGDFASDGGGVIRYGDPAGDIKKLVLEGFDSVKLAAGFNNHMGSRVTPDERIMDDVFSSLNGRNVYFIDSKTSSRSVAYRIAKKHGLRAGENDMFLDGDIREASIESRLKLLIAKARRRGSAIGIGHASRPATIRVLRKMMPRYANEGVKFVRASEVVK